MNIADRIQSLRKEKGVSQEQFIVILVAAQILAGPMASTFILIKIPKDICSVLAGLFYLGLAYGALRLCAGRAIKLPVSELGMPRFSVKWPWIIMALFLPILVKGIYLLVFDGTYISSQMREEEISFAVTGGEFGVEALKKAGSCIKAGLS